jgi:hypothetical protein
VNHKLLTWGEVPSLLYDAHGNVYCVKSGAKYPGNHNIYEVTRATAAETCVDLEGGERRPQSSDSVGSLIMMALFLVFVFIGVRFLTREEESWSR